MPRKSLGPEAEPAFTSFLYTNIQSKILPIADPELSFDWQKYEMIYRIYRPAKNQLFCSARDISRATPPHLPDQIIHFLVIQ